MASSLSFLALLLILGLNCEAAKTIYKIVDLDASRSDSNSTIDLYFSGGIPKCTNCGEPGQYACSRGVGKWNQGIQTFMDPSPDQGRNFVLTQVTAWVYGTVSCEGLGSQTMVSLTLNGQIIDVLTKSSNNLCKCNTCDGVMTYSTDIFFGGMTGYNYGRMNQVQLSVLDNNYICVNKISLNLTFTVPDWRSVTINLPYTSTGANSQCAMCGTPGQYSCTNTNWNNGQAVFKDPLPQGALLMNAAARVFGVWANPYYQFIWVSSLQGVTVGNATPTAVSDVNNMCDKCSPTVFLGTNNWYQAGWPGYEYGKNNTFTLNVNGGNGYSRGCVSLVQLTLGYYLNN